MGFIKKGVALISHPSIFSSILFLGILFVYVITHAN